MVTSGGQAAAVAYASRIRLLIKALLVMNRSGWLIAGFVAALFVGGILDYFFRAPGSLRTAGLLGATVMVVSLLSRRLLPALRFRPSVEDIALRLATPSGQFGIPAAIGLGKGFAGEAERGGGSGITGKLAALAGELIGSSGVGKLSGAGLIRWQPAARAAGALVLACLLVVSMFAFEPGLAGIGTRRMLLPWTDAAWPRRYHVEPLGTAAVAPLGQAIVLQAGLVNAPGKLEQTDVAANITVIVDGKARKMRTVMLTPQDRRKVVGYTGELGERATAEALVFERLLEPGALDLQTVPGENPPEAVTLRYSLTAGDHTTPEQTLKLVRPPVVTALTVRMNPPAYARQVSGAAVPGSVMGGSAVGDAVTAAGPQKREFANPSGTVIVPGVMEGSDVAVDITLSRALVLPSDIAATLGPQVAQLVASGKATLVTSGEAVASGAPGATLSNTWQLALSLRESLAMPIKLVDADGLKTPEDVGLRLDMKPDRLPEPVVTLPASDQVVTPQATVDVGIEARDDQGLTAVVARAQRAVRARGSMGAEPEPAFAPVVLAQAEITTPVLTSKLTSTVVPGKLGAVPGDEVLLTAVAQDNYEIEGRRHDAVISQPRRLRIVSAEQLAEKLIADLSAVRRGIIASTERQDGLSKAAAKAEGQLAQAAAAAEAGQTREPAEAAADKAARESLQKTARDQAELARQLDRLGEQAAAAASASRQNKLDPAAAEQAASKAAQALQRATEASAKASADAEAAAKAAEQAQQSEAAAESASGADAKAQAKAAAARAAAQAAASGQKAQAEQKQTEKALSEAADALDRGQDAWAARRMLSELADQQKAVREATKQAGQSTAGKKAEQLSNPERAALQQAAEQQDELARRAGELEQKLQQQAEALKERDPASAETLQDAAKRARQADLAEQMRKAAEQTRNNQAGQAQEGQQKAENTLRSMLEQLDQAKANRDAVLKRQLDSLVQSIDTLIAQQELELKRLADAAASGRFDGLDQSMIRLHAGTLSVLDKAQGEGGSKKAAELLKAAADAQVAAIGDLRAKPMRADEARQNETQSRKLLGEAKAAAQEAKEEAAEREASERRRVLRVAYESILEDQKAITADTLPLVGKAADRRNRQTAAGLVARQDLVAPRLDDLRDKLAELADSGVFQLAHDRIKSASATASGLLKSGKWANQLAGRQAAVERTLQALIDALKEKDDNDKDFRENEQGDQAGQQGGGQGQKEPLLPPVTELEILKGMQREAMISTREAAEAGDVDAAKLAGTEAASIQRTLTERARDIVEKLSKVQGQ